jgi:hypothetical protein
MANDYYSRSYDFTPFTRVRSGELDDEFNAILTGLDAVEVDMDNRIQLPATFTGNNVLPEVTVENTIPYIGSDGDVALYSLTAFDGDVAAAAASAAAALVSEGAASTSETNAGTSATNAATSETNAGTSETNAAASEALAQQWAVEVEDTVVSGGQYSAFHWAQKSAAISGLPNVQGTGTDDPATPGAVLNAELLFINANLDELCEIGYQSTDDFIIKNKAHSGLVVLKGEDAGGVVRNLLVGNPDGASTIYHAGTAVAATLTTGLSVSELTSTVATGTAPLTVASTTVVANLNADLLDGLEGSAYYLASNPNGYTNDQTPAEILAAMLTVDGAASGHMQSHVPTT